MTSDLKINNCTDYLRASIKFLSEKIINLKKLLHYPETSHREHAFTTPLLLFFFCTLNTMYLDTLSNMNKTCKKYDSRKKIK